MVRPAAVNRGDETFIGRQPVNSRLAGKPRGQDIDPPINGGNRPFQGSASFDDQVFKRAVKAPSIWAK